jgi:hypothetical protein
MPTLAAAIETFGMQHAVDFGSARRRPAPGRRSEGGGERIRVCAPALEAGTVTGGERGRFVEEEQLGIAPSPYVAMASLEFEPAANPAARDPSPHAEGAIIAMETTAAIAEEKTAGAVGKQPTKRIDPIGQRH